MKRGIHPGRLRNGGLHLQVFTPDELEDIHLATLEVLEKTGLFVESEEALAVFDGGGCDIDPKKKVVRIPPYLVEDAIRSAPAKLFLAGRDPKHDIVLESNRVAFTNFGEGIQVVDPYTGELREPTKGDLCRAARLIDYLDSVDVCEKALGAHDVPQEVAGVHNADAFLSNTTKHLFMGPGDGEQLTAIVDMAAAVAGGRDKLRQRPLVSFITCPVSPLKLVQHCCEIIMAAARENLVINVLSMAMAGGSSPVTLAGTLVTHNAEVLGGLVLAQLVRKGTPFVYGSSTTAMDLRHAAASVGSPECAMISAAVAQMARYYLLPSWVAGG